jgi:hypothetical protein
MLVSVPVQTQSGFVAGKPVPLFPAGQYFVNVARDYDVMPDGSRFVFVRTIRQVPRQSFTVVTNWFQELRARTAAR